MQTILSSLSCKPFQEISLDSTVSDFLTAQCQLSMDGPRLRPLSIRTEGAEARKTNGADGSDDSDDLVKQQILFLSQLRPIVTFV